VCVSDTKVCNDSDPCHVPDCRPDVGCEYTFKPGCRPCVTDADCTDEDACNGTEVCDAGYCRSGVPPTCKACVEACDRVAGCTAQASNVAIRCTLSAAVSEPPCASGSVPTAIASAFKAAASLFDKAANEDVAGRKRSELRQALGKLTAALSSART